MDVFAEKELGKDIDFSKLISYKAQKNPMLESFSNIRLMLNFGMVSGILYIKLALFKIHLAKKIFILDLTRFGVRTRSLHTEGDHS